MLLRFSKVSIIFVLNKWKNLSQTGMIENIECFVFSFRVLAEF